MRLLPIALLALSLTAPSLVACGGTSSSDDDPTEETGEGALAASDRAAVMDALRAAVKPELKNQDILFDVSQGYLNTAKGYTFLLGKVVLKNGRPVDYKGTVYQQDIDEGIFDDGIAALLQKKGDGWVVLAHVIGATDVAWAEWPQRYGAPASIMPGATPAVDYAIKERKTVMDTLRAKLEPELKNQDIVFVVADGGAYNASGDWVFLRGKIRLRGSGAPVDYNGTKYEEDIREGMFDDGFGALLHRVDERWTVTDYAVGPTDVAWEGWDEKYGAPSDIFR